MPAQSNGPDTIVLVHGFWVTPRSWEHWITRYKGQGYRVLAPAYPGFEVEVEALNRDPSPIERLTVPAIMAHLEDVVERLEAPPILIGSFGGRCVRAAVARSWPWRGGRGDKLRTYGRRACHAAAALQSDVSGARRIPRIGTRQCRSRTSNGVTRSRTHLTKRTRAPRTTAITSRHQGAFSGTACWRTSFLAPRTSRSTTTTTPARPFSSYREAKII